MSDRGLKAFISWDRTATVHLEVPRQQAFVAGYDAAISEMSQPQSPETCSKGHPRWALRRRQSVLVRGSRSPDGLCATDVDPDEVECSICSAIAGAERIGALIRGAIEMLNDPQSGVPTQAIVRKLRQALKEEPHA